MAKLTPAEQKILTDVTQEAAEKASNDIRKREVELVDEFKKKGINVITVDRNDFQQRVLKAINLSNRWTTGQEGLGPHHRHQVTRLGPGPQHGRPSTTCPT